MHARDDVSVWSRFLVAFEMEGVVRVILVSRSHRAYLWVAVEVSKFGHRRGLVRIPCFL